MDKPQRSRPKPKKDRFFIAKKDHDNRRSQRLDTKPKEPNTDSGSFFVSTSEKEEIMNRRESKRNFKQKFNTEREQNIRQKKLVPEKGPKKEFDKKKWRLQKYSNKYKLQQWEEKRKKVVLNEYYKQIKDEGPKFDVQNIYEKYDEDEETENENNLNEDINEARTSNDQQQTPPDDLEDTNPRPFNLKARIKKPFKKAHDQYQRVREEKQRKDEELSKKKLERDAALQQYKQKKLEKYKKLNQKTKKGQPIMKYRMEMLLEEIQKSME